ARLVAEPPLVLLEQARRTQTRAELARHALGERDAAVGPGAGPVPVEADRAENLAAQLDRHGEHSLRPERAQKPAALVADPVLALDVGDRDGHAVTCRPR